MKLMIVDDHAEVRKVIRQLATMPEDVVCECASGNEAVRLASKFRPEDGVTVDVRMPGMCSFEATRTIRATLPSARIVIVTGYDEPFLRQVASEAGVADYLVKDNLTELHAVLTRNGTSADLSKSNTEEHSAENTEFLKARVSQLEAELLERECFPGMVAHELRAPLRAINAFASLLQSRQAANLPSEALGYLRLISENSRVMKDRLEGLIGLAASGKPGLKSEIVFTDQLVAEVWRDLRSEVTQEQVEFKAEHLPTVRGDRALLRVVFENLLENAVKYSSRQARPVIEVGCTACHDKTVFFVKDNGAGFDMEYAEQLFKPLNRLHSAEQFPGTGLGLALTRRIVQQHGGRIWAEAFEERGATFYFSLPHKRSE